MTLSNASPAESFDDYRTRVLGYLGSRDPMRVLSATPGRVRRVLTGQPRGVLVKTPAPGKWSVAEIVAHLADAELAFGWRLRSMLATPGVPLQWWDEHLWSQRCAYSKVPIGRSLETFSALRVSNLDLLRRMPAEEVDSAYGLHEKRGRQTVRDFVTMEAAHDLNHLRQIQRLLRQVR